MVNIIKTNLEMEIALKNRISFLCDYYKLKPTFINGSIRQIEKTNITYVEPHRIVIGSITLLAYNYESDLYIENLSKPIPLKDLEEYFKSLK